MLLQSSKKIFRTANIIGKNEIGMMINETQVPTIRISTANGIVECSTKGNIKTNSGLFEGFKVPESDFSLLSLSGELEGGGEYRQTSDGARIEYPDGSIREFTALNGLWAEILEPKSEYECGNDLNSCEIVMVCDKELV